VEAGAFDHTGSQIVIGSTDGTARLWRTFSSNTQALIDSAKATLPRCLTQAQCTGANGANLDPTPPPWCIASEKWPYNSTAWKEWLARRQAGKNPPLPVETDQQRR
jgi:hypothetical protein